MRATVRHLVSYGLVAAAVALILVAPLGTVLSVTTSARADTGPTEPVEPAPAVPVTVPGADRVFGAPLLVIGVGGLGWDEVSPTRTPTLWRLLDDGAAAAAVTVHTSGQPACPLGGWLSLSAGRAATSERFGGFCLGLPDVVPDPSSGGGAEGGDAAVTRATVSGWAEQAVEQAGSTYGPQIGTLGSALDAAGVCATAVGPGAALALADRNGVVARYLPAVTSAAYECPLTLVDVGVTSVLEGLGGSPLRIDARIAAVLSTVPAHASVLVTSVATTVGDRLEMGVAVASGTDVGAALMTTASTRRDGVIRLLDLPSTVVGAVGVDEPPVFQGAPLLVAHARGDAATTVDTLAEISVADRGLRAAATPLLNGLGLAALVLTVATVVLARRMSGVAPRRVAELCFLVLASAPLASYLVTVLRWWRFEAATAALWLGMTGITVVLAVALHLLPRRPLWQATLALSLVTTAVLVADAVTGATLHWGSPLGTSPVLGNRYYGFGNSTYAVFAVHTIVLAGILAARYAAAGRRRLAVLAVVAVAVVSVLVDIWPTWGADVGGGLALVPAFGVLALGVVGQRVTATRAVLVLGGAVGVVGVVAWLDWLRPASERSHAGRFVQQVLDGDAADLLGRKLDYAVASLDRGPVAWLTLAALAAAAAVVIKPDRFSPPSLDSAVRAWPGLRATLAALLVAAVLGSLVNDWGVRVATVLLTAALPVIALTCVRATAQRPSPDLTVSRSTTSATPPNTTSASAPAATPPQRAPAKPAVPNRTPTR